MKIRKVKWKGHPILGDLELDFLKPDNTPFDVVVFAGENGVGKTSILETIATFVNLGSFEFFEFIEYETEGKIVRAVPTDSEINTFYNLIDGESTTTIYAGKGRVHKESDENPLTISYNGGVFSKARADFKTEKIQSTTVKQLDVEKFDNDQEEDFTSLKQLLVDIDNQDNAIYARLNRDRGENNPLNWKEFYPTSKTFRFSKAFDDFFPNMKYEKADDVDGEKTILFKKNGKSISIDNLSTGEKQIVFRGTYLLRNIKNLTKALIFIDEPELSMHPKWQKNILEYYENLFTTDNILNSQMFFSTHSEHVLNSALNKKENHIIIILEDTQGTIESKKINAPSVLPSITTAETNYVAFDIISNDYHIELYGYLQEKFQLRKVKDTDEYIVNQTQFYNPAIHQKVYTYNHSRGTTTYNSLSTYIRNCIDHPDQIHSYSEAEIKTSIKLLIELCQQPSPV
ncbi:AAA family ATPase [Chryseobacterium sp. AG844]|uniref:AAA family ATPase n=1 Tax=Chryseobacterium sp. AG844 TaxID=2183998 RepID=UPI000D710D8B|nr:AAA family ATPase [Chryseobacterium sp. AG844]PWW30826.1 putative ATP-binding protein involved in virulence [Chryseobacterium sp. AG844]